MSWSSGLCWAKVASGWRGAKWWHLAQEWNPTWMPTGAFDSWFYGLSSRPSCSSSDRSWGMDRWHRLCGCGQWCGASCSCLVRSLPFHERGAWTGRPSPQCREKWCRSYWQAGGQGHPASTPSRRTSGVQSHERPWAGCNGWQMQTYSYHQKTKSQGQA